MKKKFYTLFVAILLTVLQGTQAQNLKPTIDASKAVGHATKSSLMITPLNGRTAFHSMDLKWQPVLTHLMPAHESPNNEMVQKIKAEKTAQKFSSNKIQNSFDESPSILTVTPTIGTNFIGNVGTGCPLDNTLAISNGDKIVSLVNSNMSYYNTSGTLLYTTDIWSWYNDPFLVNNICDPKVIYDSGADKFIFYTQTCDGISANSKVILAFSTTNDPQGLWWYYELTGNPLNDGSWWDYPKLAVSNNEVYVTGNLFYQGGGYNESIIYQINKWDGYAGNSLTWQYWYGISGNPFTLLPVSWGQQGNYGPGVSLVSTETAANSTTIHFYDITDDISATNEQLNHYTISTTSYSIGGQAGQSGGGNLDVGDTRAQAGFYLNGFVHFVFHSDIGSGWNGINYNRLDVSGLTNTSSTFGLVGTYDYCYPAVASYATTTSDKSVMIVFERSGSTIYPEFRVVNCDNAMNWSNSTQIKGGLTSISTCYDPNHNAERWGDYTGISRKHNSGSASIWGCGAYANNSNYWNTWIAEVHGTASGIEENNATASSVNLYPNPVSDIFKTEFTLDKNQKIKINIADIEGKIVKELFEGFATKGENVFTFKKENLSKGLYFLQIINPLNEIIKNEKFVIGD